MDATPPPPADPVALVGQLDPVALRVHIDRLGRERDALLVLLRAANRARPRPTVAAPAVEGVSRG